MEKRLTSSFGSFASWISILKLAEALELMIAESLFFLSLILDTFGVFELPGTGTVRWKIGFRGAMRLKGMFE